MKVRQFGFGLSFILIILLTACNSTNYYNYTETPKRENIFSRDVYYSLGDNYYFTSPNCVFIISTSSPQVPKGFQNIMAEAIATKLRRYYRRVIDLNERQMLERELGLVARDSIGIKQFARLENCPVYLAWNFYQVGNTHLLIWSQRQIGLNVKLVRAFDQSVLWQASHTTSRSSGAPPFSLLSVPIAAVDAHLFKHDKDHIPSMIDDLVRRLFITLPKIVSKVSSKFYA